MNLAIKQAIVAKLETIDSLAEVKGHAGQIDNYPSAEIVGVAKSQEREGLQTIYKTYKYTLRVSQEISSDLRDIEENTDLLETIAEQIDNAFDSDDTLGGAVDDIQLTMTETIEQRELLMVVVECEIEAKKLKQLT